MSSVVSVEEIERDIASLNAKIQRCHKTKQEMLTAIQQEHETATELKFFIREEKRRKPGERSRYDIVSMEHNVNRCTQNIKVFEETMGREDASIEKFRYMINVLTEDLKRPKEIRFDAKTGQVL